MRVHITSSGPRTGSTLLFEKLKLACAWGKASSHEDHIFVTDSSVEPAHSSQSIDVLTKSPRHFALVILALLLRKDLLVISVVRDPRDVVLSLHKGDSKAYYSDMSFFFRYHRLRPLVISNSRFLEIHYEDFANDEKEVTLKILEFLSTHGIRNQQSRNKDHTVSYQAAQALGELRPVDTKSIGKWKQEHHRDVIQYYYQRHGINKLNYALKNLGYRPHYPRFITPIAPVTSLKSVKHDDRHFFRNMYYLLRSLVTL